MLITHFLLSLWVCAGSGLVRGNAAAVSGVAKRAILEHLEKRKQRDAVFYYNNRMMAEEDAAVKRVRKLLDVKGA